MTKPTDPNNSVAGLDAIRSEFLTEAELQVARFLDEFKSRIDLEDLRKCAHKWGGAGRMLGCERLGAAATELETLLKTPGAAKREKVLTALEALRGLILSERASEDKPGAMPAASHPARDSAGTRPCILVVDDDPVIVSLIQLALESCRVECQTVDRGDLAVDMAERNRPQAIVLDINVPEMDGFAILTRLKSRDRTRSIPVLMLTAAKGEGDIARALELGADDYVVKPFDPAELAKRLLRLIAPGRHG